MIKWLFLLNISACATVPNLDTAAIYKKDMEVVLNGQEYKGVASVKQRTQHNIEFKLPQKPDLLKIATCHRELTVQKPGKTYRYRYDPVQRELVIPCPMQVIALDKEGENSWAIIDFVGSDEQLQAKIGCNGEAYSAVGSAICQARAGLVQTISFDNVVIGKGSARCPDLDKFESKVFEYNINDDFCQYVFLGDGKTFRLMTSGYNEVLIYDD